MRQIRLAAYGLAVPAMLWLSGASASGVFGDGFDGTGTLVETGSPGSSASPDWWLNSGAYFHRQGGVGATLQGRLPSNDPWRVEYARTNPRDTDDGYLPQNLFRLVTRHLWKDLDQQVYFRITATNLTDTPERDAWSGVLLFNRYVDSDNLYYAGLRHDGAAVIKRKRYGSYTTLASRKIYPGTYDRWSSPNLLPQNAWIGLRTVVRNELHGSVTVRLDAADPALGAGWTPLLEVSDTALSRIITAGAAGIRTDYSDVQFDDYSIVGGARWKTPSDLWVFRDSLERDGNF